MSNMSDHHLANIGRGLSLYSPLSDVTGGASSNGGMERVKQSIELIFGIMKGEIPMLNVLGNTLPWNVFDPSDQDLYESIRVSLQDSLEYLEPRVQLREVTVTGEDHVVYIYLEGNLRNTNITFSFDYEITRGNRGDV